MRNRILLPHVSPLFLGSEKAAELYVDEVLDGAGFLQYLDKSGSVSASVEVEEDCDYVTDHNTLFLEKVLNGS